MTKAPDFLDPIEAQILTNTAKFVRDISDGRLDCFAHDIKWGTYGPKGTDQLVFKPLDKLDTEHLENILITQPDLRPLFIRVVLHILKKRYTATASTTATPATRPVKLVEVVITGHDSWNGPEILRVETFDTKDGAASYCRKFNAKNNLPQVPDYYETAQIRD
jgi:hypothetical protein